MTEDSVDSIVEETVDDERPRARLETKISIINGPAYANWSWKSLTPVDSMYREFHALGRSLGTSQPRSDKFAIDRSDKKKKVIPVPQDARIYGWMKYDLPVGIDGFKRQRFILGLEGFDNVMKHPEWRVLRRETPTLLDGFRLDFPLLKWCMFENEEETLKHTFKFEHIYTSRMNCLTFFLALNNCSRTKKR